ncbi:velvet factor-domain-containing protein [Plectosphaerella plurivora]|uniref:Velvet factor-domain-containing protein n=1 Tax=Plectosphaerella plurivora TaxID=936078 RepID=A0A9P8VLJ0_9PEZI|nr:velvet factor-domain-containing protein [Plectosphaerella plurivora]
MSGDIFSAYSFGSSPGGHPGAMGFSVGGFTQNNSLDAQLYGGASSLDAPLEPTSDNDYRLFMEQQPMIGLATDKEKGKPQAHRPATDPYCFMICHLKKITKDETGETHEESTEGNKLSGSIVSSLHRLRNTENRDVGYFVFADMYPKDPGEYRLLFTLYEMTREDSESFVELATIESATFPVWPLKSFPGLKQSTYLTRAISDQGVRVRLRKDSRQSLSNRRKRHVSLTGADDGPVWQQQPRRHVTAPQLGGSPMPRPRDMSSSAARTARSSHSISPTQQSQRHTSLGYSLPTSHIPSPITTHMYTDSLSSLANPQSSRDRQMRLGNAGLRLPTPQAQGQFLTTPPPSARMGNANFYTFSSNPVMNQNSCYSSADTGSISTMLPLHQHQHHPHQGQ